jgi:hypothetical protein
MENSIKDNNLIKQFIEQKITIQEYLSELFNQLEVDSD